jgi:hypothetical protein
MNKIIIPAQTILSKGVGVLDIIGINDVMMSEKNQKVIEINQSF